MKNTQSIVWISILAALVSPILSCSSSNSSDTRNQPINEVFKEKPLPVLGTYDQQLKFRIKDNSAILNGTPRPTFPKKMAVLAGNPPKGVDVCDLFYSALIKKMYEQCFPDGMSYIGMSNIIGFKGDEISRSGELVSYQWNDSDEGSMIATFKDGKLSSISQRGLK